MRIVTENPLATLSAVTLSLCLIGVLSFWVHLLPLSPKNILGSLALTAWVCFPAVFNFIRGLGASSIARSWRAALILSVPSALAVALVFYVRVGTSDPQSPLALVFWPFGFIVLLPVAWAFGRGYHDNYERPLPNNSFKPKPLRGSA